MDRPQGLCPNEKGKGREIRRKSQGSDLGRPEVLGVEAEVVDGRRARKAK